MSQSSADVAVVVVYFRTPDTLVQCLAALEMQRPRPSEIVVVDNSSVEDGVSDPPAPPGGWVWLRSPCNIGFAAACNFGARLTSAPFVLFVNADVRLRTGALAALRERLVVDPQAVVAGPRVWNAKGEIELSARKFPGARTGLFGRTSLATRMLLRLGQTPAELGAALDGPRQVDWVSGACQLVRRDAFLAVGGFDEGYWMYWEDADLCWRLAARGGRVWFEPAAETDHDGGASGNSARTVRAFHESAGRFYDRHIARSHLDAGIARSLLMARAHARLWRLPRSNRS